MLKLRQMMERALPRLAIPTAYIPLTFMPRTQSDCIDRRALRKLAASFRPRDTYINRDASTEFTERVTERERAMARLWADALGLDIAAISAESRWMALGGDSVLAMRLNASARAAGFSITIANILSKTLAELAESSTSSPSALELPQSPGPLARLASFGEKPGLWPTLQRFTGCCKADVEDIGEATDYQCTMFCSAMSTERGWDHHVCLDISPDVDVDVIERACYSIVAAHAILRTVFFPFQQGLLQVIIKRARIDFYKTTATDIEASTAHWIAKDRELPVSFTSPVMRAAIISEEGYRQRLILGISHAQHDATSLASLCVDLDKSMAGRVLRQPSLSFMDYVHTANKSFTPEARYYWRQYLQGSSMTTLVHHDKPLFQNRIRGPVFSQRISLPDTTKPRFTLATITTAAWSYVLSQWASTEDVVFGSLVSGRGFHSQDVTGVVGPCLNIVPTRVRLTGLLPWELLEHVHSAHTATLPFEANGYQRVITSCTDWPPWTRFSSNVHYENAGPPDARMEIKPTENDTADLWIVTKPLGSTMLVQLMCSENILPASTAAILGRYLCSVLGDFVLLSSDAAYEPLRLDAGTVFKSLPELPIRHENHEPRLSSRGSDLGKVRAAWRSAGLDPSMALHEQSTSALPAVTLANLYKELFPDQAISVDDLVAAATVEGHARLLKYRLEQTRFSDYKT